ncbi:hypothetical protein PFISCL1PPCAC_14895 [Pristionchus fissidentatus]|uniref:Uncharacterized protein n=1 Tax=Pristionchus fissidentatus TaxID=1538716 RepID=A0AAV5VW16_9BILA|nr:hypothetical protein PFISCL1PPCAC_14895 [Pristionchus fissidentatus]
MSTSNLLSSTIPSSTTPSSSVPRRNGHSNRGGGRINTNDFEIRRRVSNKPKLAPNHFYISSKLNPQREADRIENLLRNEMREVHIHGMGVSIVKAMSVVARIEQKMVGSMKKSLRTSTVTVKDDLFPLSDEAELSTRARPLSAIHFTLTRLSPL